MELRLEWLPPIELLRNTDNGQIYCCDQNALPDQSGVYIFARKHGNNFEVLYIGLATSSLRGRVRQQFNNLKLMKYIENAKSGGRLLHVGKFVPGRAQQPKRCLPIIERSLIRHFLEEGHPLVNVQATRITTHEILSEGSLLAVPKKMAVDAK